MTFMECLGIFWKLLSFLWVSEVRIHNSLAFPDPRDGTVALSIQFFYDPVNFSSCACCLPDQRNQPLLHSDMCGGGWGAASHCPPAVLLQALQRHRSVPSGCQHHFWIKSQCSNMFTGDCHEVLLRNKWKGKVWWSGAEASKPGCLAWAPVPLTCYGTVGFFIWTLLYLILLIYKMKIIV